MAHFVVRDTNPRSLRISLTQLSKRELHKYAPLLTSDDDMESDDEALQTRFSLSKRQKRNKQISRSPDHDDDSVSDEERSTEKNKNRPLWTHSYLSPIDSDVDDGSLKHRRRGGPESAEGQTKSAQQDAVSAEVKEKPKRGCKAKQFKGCKFISLAENESKSESGVSEVPQKKRGRPKKVKQAENVSESFVQESKTKASRKEKTRKQQNHKQTNKHIPTETASDPENEVATKRAKKQKAQTSKKPRGKRSTTPGSAASPNHSLSDLEDTAGCQKNKTSFQNFERSSDLEDDGSRGSSPEHSDKHTDVSGNEVESESLKQSCNKFRKNRKSSWALKDPSSYSESEDDEKKQRRKKTTKGKRRASGDSDFLEWPIGGSSARPRAKKKEVRESKSKGPIECKICGRNIRCKAIMERHMLTHTGEKPFECDECGRRYTSSSNLRIHQQSHTGKMDYSCEECGQKFTHLPYLKRHLLRHSGKKLHMCDQCGKGFIQKYHLTRHLLVHSGKMPYACDKCDASFNRTDYLSLHMRNVHLSECSENDIQPEIKRPYKCDVCDKAFTTRTTLDAHARVHSGIKPYSCNICQRMFKQSSQMHSHLRTHSGEKPHSCNLCGMKFARRNYVKVHKEKRHAAKNDSP
ncbi:zinc finger protein 37-like isoform X2 [Pygocentrus nattereri]|uniref:C2H2-type domain-containing protein n=1 Tax=Pygocentrus nattereri TaxID=42514 RepID=A0AAR2LDU2_PYGNA|nr:zinc finger protein 37-like isoform X2 [Pygocentrus nattereri]XP_037396406.1 zinc finger protein 37-like isoform X2 [Pygocentrus nattereri]XP_037396407.1 zinc finger protein 37-like isoform X2 [Pygocentrus nattereri]